MYTLLVDDEGRWYVYPEEKEEEAYQYIVQLAKIDAEFPDRPDWMHPVNSLLNLQFTEYRINSHGN